MLTPRLQQSGLRDLGLVADAVQQGGVPGVAAGQQQVAALHDGRRLRRHQDHRIRQQQRPERQ